MTKILDREEFELVEYRVGMGDYRDVAAYDRVRYSGPANEYRQKVMANAYQKLLGSLHDKRVLDVGCGTGRGVVEFKDSAGFAVGCDVSHDMLRFGERKAEGSAKYGLVQAFAQGLPFKEQTFDVVTALNFLHLFSLKSQKEMVGEMKRVVKRGGIVVLEFDNALHGLMVGFYKRWFRDERGSLPHEISFVIGDKCRIVRIVGAVFPIIWRVLYRCPRLSQEIEKIAYFAPFNRLSQRIYYLVRVEG